METKDWIVFKCNQKMPESETAYNLLSEKNREVLDKWLGEKSITSKGVKRIGNRKRSIVKFLTFINKDYDEITYEDYISVASAINKNEMGVYQKNEDKYFISRFLKDIFEDWEKRFKVRDSKEGLKYLKMEKQTEDKKIKPSELLTELEIDRLMKVTSDMKKISLIAVLSVSGARPEEILKLTWREVDLDKKLIHLYSSKTGKIRAVPIDSAINHLKRLKQETGASEENLVFPSPSNKIMSNAGLNSMLQELGKKAMIKKRVWAYLFRHTRLSYLITKLSPKVYEEVAGHSLEMGMKTYAHLSQDVVIKEMREKIFQVQDLNQDEKTEYEKRIKLLETWQKQVENAINSNPPLFKMLGLAAVKKAIES